MSPKPNHWMNRLNRVEMEYRAIRLATDQLIYIVRVNPTILTDKLTPSHLDNASMSLETTYLVRLQAEFEIGLRLYWRSIRKSRTKPSMVVLLGLVAARRDIPDEVVNNADQIRELRNRIIHEGDDTVVMIPLRVARSRLCSYLARLPLDW